MNKNTKIRIKVPKSLYESIQQEIKKEGVKHQESGQYYSDRAMKGGITNENEEALDEYYGVDPKLDIATLAAGGATAAATAIAAIVQQLGVKGTLKLVKDIISGKGKSGVSENDDEMSGEVVKEFSMEQLSEAVKKAKAKKAAAAKKEKEKEAAKKEKEKEAAKKEKEAAKKK